MGRDSYAAHRRLRARAKRKIPARYCVAIEQRTFLGVVDWNHRSGAPDVSVVERRMPGLREAAVAYAGMPQVVVVPLEEEIVERHLEIVDLENQVVVTAIDFLSPSNKLSQEGRRHYLCKRRRLLNGQTHFVEIDLLRAGRPMELAILPRHLCDYRVLVSRVLRAAAGASLRVQRAGADSGLSDPVAHGGARTGD